MSTGTILAIDDDRSLLDFYALLLEAEGYRVVTAATPNEVDAVLAAHPPDLVVTDVVLPGLPDWAVVTRLQTDPVLCGIPVVVCSGAVQELEAYAAHLGRADIRTLAKPFDMEALLRCVEELLAGERDAPRPHRRNGPPSE